MVYLSGAGLPWKKGRQTDAVVTVVVVVVVVFTHRRSIAERGGCFQRRLFVCLSTR